MKRKIIKQVKGFATIDGAGVHLIRVLSNKTAKIFDPILMLDSFDSLDPKEYTKGFPMHPHRGIETISYLIKGKMVHRDNFGFNDTISDGELQWMTAGSGIIHEEKLPESNRMLGVQLWLNLPSDKKMVKPEYKSIKNIEQINIENGVLRLLAGSYENKQGYQSKYLPLDYYDISIKENSSFKIKTRNNDSVMLFTLLGQIDVENETISEKTAAKLSEGESLEIKSKDQPARVLFISSQSLNENIAWGGPIVMNTQDELNKAFEDLSNGNFIKK